MFAPAAVRMVRANRSSDTFAAIALCSEPPREGLMRMKPKRRDENIVTPAMKITIGSPKPGLPPEDAERVKAELHMANKYAIKLYWVSLLIVTIVTALVTITENPREGARALGIAGVVIAFFLPAGQLVASVLALITINVFPPVRKPECLRRLGRMTLYSFVWGLIGSALTFLLLYGVFK